MQFTVSDKSVLDIVSIVQRATDKKGVIPAYEGIKIEVNHNTIFFTGIGDLIGICGGIVDIYNVEPGSAFVNAINLANLIKQLPDDKPIEFKVDAIKNKLNINYGKSSTVLNLLDDSDWPGLVNTEDAEEIAFFKGADLKNAFHKTLFACATNHFKPVFTGILLDFAGDKTVDIVASDTYRLSVASIELENKAEKTGQWVIPLRAAAELSRIVSPEDKIHMLQLTNNVLFIIEKTEVPLTFITRTIEGQYPNYRQVIPNDIIANIEIDSSKLLEAVNRINVFADSTGSGIKTVKIAVDSNEAILTSVSDNRGQITEIVEINKSDGEFTDAIHFNAKYLQQILNVIVNESPTVSIGLTGAIKPAIFKIPNLETFTHVLVPIRVN